MSGISLKKTLCAKEPFVLVLASLTNLVSGDKLYDLARHPSLFTNELQPELVEIIVRQSDSRT